MRNNTRRLLTRDPWFMAGTAMLLMIAAAALFGPVLVPHDPHDISFIPLDSPSAKHWLGVNDGGMDIMSELVYSLRNTLVFGLFAGLTALTIGVVAGLVAALTRGWIDEVIMRVADVILAVPAVMILILLAAFFRPSSLVLALTLALLAWPTTAKGVRAQALTLTNSLHIQSARRMGASNRYILFRHLMPELFPLYLISFAAKTRMAVFMEASLAFLGLFDPGRKSLGVMISYSLKYYYLDIWLNWLMPPILCLSLLIMSGTFLAVSMEKVFDPRLKEAL